ncbi:hypothetical protein GCM10010401_07400 [Rarobacter faecitabidus]|uniref:hypothetical protein n=1 Tax=Rarobacter faecitabidus TaxID=13243 RepID=UPI0031DDBD21
MALINARRVSDGKTVIVAESYLKVFPTEYQPIAAETSGESGAQPHVRKNNKTSAKSEDDTKEA